MFYSLPRITERQQDLGAVIYSYITTTRKKKKNDVKIDRHNRDFKLRCKCYINILYPTNILYVKVLKRRIRFIFQHNSTGPKFGRLH